MNKNVFEIKIGETLSDSKIKIVILLFDLSFEHSGCWIFDGFDSNIFFDHLCCTIETLDALLL